MKDKKEERRKRKEEKAKKEKLFLELLDKIGIQRPIPEYSFHPTRQWRMDYAWPHQKICLEVEGGIFTRGRHTRGAGFKGDMEKYNEAARLGWQILRCTPTDLFKTETAQLLRKVIINQ